MPPQRSMLCVGIDSGTPPKLQVTDRLFPAFFRLEGKPGTSITTAPALGPTETVSAAGQLSDEELALLASAPVTALAAVAALAALAAFGSELFIFALFQSDPDPGLRHGRSRQPRTRTSTGSHVLRLWSNDAWMGRAPCLFAACTAAGMPSTTQDSQDASCTRHSQRKPAPWHHCASSRRRHHPCW